MKLSAFIDLVIDAERRDLTINAIAIEIFNDEKTRIVGYVDPFNGRADIVNRTMRHVGPAFAEDPVRVLRLARFRARFGPTWKIAKETRDLCSEMAKRGKLNSLQPDRVWKELSRALMEPHPRLFFDTLLEVDALHVVFPMIYKLKTALEARRWHPEGDAFEHTMLVLTAAAEMNATLEERIACLCHDFGKGLTPRDKLPKHYGHDIAGVKVIEDFAKLVSIPKDFIENAKISAIFHMRGHELDKLTPKTFVKIFDACGATHTTNRAVDVLLMVFKADERGRLGFHDAPLEKFDLFEEKLKKYRSVKFSDVFKTVPPTDKIAEGMRRARIAAVAK